MCNFCQKLFILSLGIVLFLIITLNYVGVMVIYIGVPLIVVCGWISSWKMCRNKLKENIKNIL